MIDYKPFGNFSHQRLPGEPMRSYRSSVLSCEHPVSVGVLTSCPLPAITISVNKFPESIVRGFRIRVISVPRSLPPCVVRSTPTVRLMLSLASFDLAYPAVVHSQSSRLSNILHLKPKRDPKGSRIDACL